MSKAFASQADLAPKAVTFRQLSENAWAYTTEGDPNSGVIIGDDAVMVLDTTATPAMAQDLIARIRSLTDKPIRHVVLSHYHAVRVLGASAYGATNIFASKGTWEMIAERGAADWQSEMERFPRLFRNAESIPGLTWPTVVFEREVTVFMGKLEVRLMHLGSGHTKGDVIAWIPSQGVVFSGDLVEYAATPYCGDAQLAEWPATLERLAALCPERLVPGRGDALESPDACQRAIAMTREFVTTLLAEVRRGREAGQSLKAIYDATYAVMKPRYGDWVIFEHCMPFDVVRAYDEASGIQHPRIWTAERDREMWAALAG